jgi:hypothetical protein
MVLSMQELDSRLSASLGRGLGKADQCSSSAFLLAHFTTWGPAQLHSCTLRRDHSDDGTYGSTPQVCANMGMLPECSVGTPPAAPAYLPVLLDGRVLGYVSAANAHGLVARLREVKAANLAQMEQGMVPPGLLPAEGPEVQVRRWACQPCVGTGCPRSCCMS